MRRTALLFAGAAAKWVDDDGTVYCGGSTWNAPGATELRSRLNGAVLGEECEMLPLYPKDEFLGEIVDSTSWYQDRDIFGERNAARVVAWEAQNLVCEDLLVDRLNLPKKVGKLIWNHLGGKDGWNWGKCQEWDTQNTCRGGCPERVKTFMSI